MTPQQITSRFQIKSSIDSVKPFGTSLINTTYKETTCETDAPNYLLQIINHHIFQNVPELTRNIQRVTSHIRTKLEAQGLNDIDRRVLTPINTKMEMVSFRTRREIIGGCSCLLKEPARTNS